MHKAVTKPRAHHYLSQCYLQGFAIISKKRKTIWVYTKSDSPRKSTVVNEAHERDFYAVELDGEKRQDFEVTLSQIEGIVAPVLKRIRQEPRYELTNPDRGVLAIFTALSFYRVHQGREFLDQLSVEVAQNILRNRAENAVTFSAEYRLVDGGAGWEERAEVFRQEVLHSRLDIRQTSKAFNLHYVVEATFMLAPLLGGMEWKFWRADHADEFFAGDNPVVTLQPTKRGRAVIGSGFGLPDTEIYFPLGSNVCLVMKHHHRKTPQWTLPTVDELNDAMMLAATKRIYTRSFSKHTDQLFQNIGCQIRYGENAFIDGRQPSGLGD
jgi:hypothetical protein